MPSKDIIREFAAGSFYHVYNRGINKSPTFIDERDYKVFLYYLKSFLSTKEQLDRSEKYYDSRRGNYSDQVKLISFCLLPNHYHLFMQQAKADGLPNVMRALSNAYTRYFNQRHKRIGPLFQGRYKASLIQDEAYFAHISRYIIEILLGSVSKSKLIPIPATSTSLALNLVPFG